MIELKNELRDEKEKASELNPIQEEQGKDRLLQVYLTPEQFEHFLDVHKWYRSPSYSHTFRLIVEDIVKGLGTGEYVKMVRGE